jgi:hypothetical protein
MDNETQKGESIAALAESLHGRIAMVWGSAEDVRNEIEGALEDFAAAQETAFKERVMPERIKSIIEADAYEIINLPKHPNPAFNDGLATGWNACRQEVLTRIERPSQ